MVMVEAYDRIYFAHGIDDYENVKKNNNNHVHTHFIYIQDDKLFA